MAKRLWIEGEGLEVGDVGYLVEVHRQNYRAPTTTTHHLADRPPYTNQSHEPRLHGWCGETNNVSRYGCGMARVQRVTANGRAFVVELTGAELLEALEATGFPELAP